MNPAKSQVRVVRCAEQASSVTGSGDGGKKTESTSPRPSPQSGEGAALGVCELQARGVVALTKAQMAAALQVCPRTISDMMRRGEISYFKIGSRLVRFRVEDALKRMSETVLVTAEGGKQ